MKDIVLFVLEVWLELETPVDALKVNWPKDPSVLVNAKMMSCSIRMEIVTPVD